jgi:hypothetical protein
MSRREFITLVEGTILRRRLAATFLAGVLSIALHATGYSGESKKPIRIGVISFAEPALRTDLDQSLIRGLRRRGQPYYRVGATPTATEAAFRRSRGISPE